MVTLFVQNNIQKKNELKIQRKQRYRWKRYRSMTRRNFRHFPPATGRMTPNSFCLWRHKGATIWFLWGGGGAGRFRKKKFPAVMLGKKIIRPEGPAKKILWLALGSGFALRYLFSHSKLHLSHSEICFRSPKSAFRTPWTALRSPKNYIIYSGNDFSHYKKEVFCSLKNVFCTPPPPRFNEMSSGRF